MFYAMSDPHFNHGNIMKYCHRTKWMNDHELSVMQSNDEEAKKKLKVSFESIALMNQEIISNINKTVGEKDFLLILGDWCFHSEPKVFLDQINCKNIEFILGNHDKEYAIRSCFPKCYELRNYSVSHDGEQVLSGRNGKRSQTIVACHYAMAVWDKRHHGAVHLYGHSHSDAEHWLDEIIPNRKSMDVGVDNIYKLFGEYRPISFLEIMKYLDSKQKDNLSEQEFVNKWMKRAIENLNDDLEECAMRHAIGNLVATGKHYLESKKVYLDLEPNLKGSKVKEEELLPSFVKGKYYEKNK